MPSVVALGVILGLELSVNILARPVELAAFAQFGAAVLECPKLLSPGLPLQRNVDYKPDRTKFTK